MLAFEISLNGEKLCVAGIENEGALSAIVGSIAKPDGQDVFLHVGGLVHATHEDVHWIRRAPLQINDEIRVRIIRTAQADRPVDRHSTHAEPPPDRHIGGIIGPY